MKTYVKIVGDVNDGDYVSSFDEVDDLHVAALKRVAQAINNCDAGHNWDRYTESYREHYKGILNEEEIDIFNEYLPYAPSDGDEVHSIEEISLYIVQEKIQLI